MAGRPADNLIGFVSGKLRALYKVEGSGHARWMCVCDPKLGGCGKMKEVLACNLKRHYTKSCGACAIQEAPAWSLTNVN